MTTKKTTDQKTGKPVELKEEDLDKMKGAGLLSSPMGLGRGKKAATQPLQNQPFTPHSS